jgi:hypothetical protein
VKLKTKIKLKPQNSSMEKMAEIKKNYQYGHGVVSVVPSFCWHDWNH